MNEHLDQRDIDITFHGRVRDRRWLLRSALAASAGGSFALAGGLPSRLAAAQETPAIDATLTPDIAIEPAQHEGGTLIHGAAADVNSIMPHTFDSPVSVHALSLVYESLNTKDPQTGEPVGVLAESWEQAEDGVTWTFKLHDGVTWHDGEPFDADDVKFSFDLYANPETGSFVVALMEDLIASVEVVDPLTVRFVAKEPFVDFPLLATVDRLIMAEHVLGPVPPADLNAGPITSGAQPEMIVGTGPFTYVEWTPLDKLVVARNDAYWGGAPHLDQIIWRYISDHAAITSLLRSGDIDVAWIDTIGSVSELEGGDLNLLYFPVGPWINLMWINLDPEKSTLLSDVRVRQALMYGLDREAAVKADGLGLGTVANSILPPVFPAGGADRVTVRYPYDPEKANALLDEAGWAMGADGVREKEGQQLAFNLWYATNWPPSESWVVVAQEQWRQIGVQATPTSEQDPQLVARASETYDFDALFWDWGWVTPDLTDIFACASYPGRQNRTKYCNPAVDELLAAARVERNPERRGELNAELQDLILTDLPMLPSHFGYGLVAVNKRVHNFVKGPFSDWGMPNAQDIWMEPV